ncbi:MAG: dipeptide/oligopeptide/nickel ABC transporter ATP-binding protein [Puniceicoccales bacterium]|jgi:ABC-type dipeptide/oligopeptide/nickel transport system ATPase subunit|nr:dipeptide/oligopeptide/nickel ABC transporter ATP-binding protein [Puniceicoccales bacterium]
MQKPTHSSQHLAIQDGTICFDVRRGFQKKEYFEVLKNVSLTISPGKCLGLVGESGSGKSTLGRCLARLQRLTNGMVLLGGQSAFAYPAKTFHRKVQMIFQSPAETLDPSQSVHSAISEPLHIHFPQMNRYDRERRISELLDAVHLSTSLLNSRPLALSGGQRQLVAIARALAVSPEFLICDEVASALDAKIKGEIFRLLAELQRTNGIGILFISHDISAIRALCSSAMILHGGKLFNAAPGCEFLRKSKRNRQVLWQFLPPSGFESASTFVNENASGSHGHPPG